ncbi:MAG: hypothetical protein AVO34_02010 [Firmicutes bacterium ML8_F2]|jgi:molecular chaperone GrpE|nr:MAG: hypothetical protein AVO34_02010 [Firmicutes bacterium ML8_F2]
MGKDENLTYISEETEGVKKVKLAKSKAIKLKLKECQDEKEEYLTQVQRARADLINFRRRQEQAIEELGKYGQETFIRELLPVLDSLRIGARNNPELKSVKKQLEGILKNRGLGEIGTKGEKFNPEFHEAIQQVKSKKESGIIIEEVQKGYLLNNKVLRPSKVKIAK